MGVISLTQSAAIALAPYNVNVNAVCPGFVPTLMAEDIGRGYMKHFGISKEQRIEQQIQGAPFKRLQQPEDIAAAIAFLASDDAREITGVTLERERGHVHQRVTAREASRAVEGRILAEARGRDEP